MREQTTKFLIILAAGWLFRGFFLYLLFDRYSFDLESWNWLGSVMKNGGNPYHMTDRLNWPPFWMQFIYLFQITSQYLHCTFNDVVRVFLIGVESLLAWLLYAALRRFTDASRAGQLLLLGLAVNPICVFQVCQHANFDVLVGLWMLLAVVMVLRFQEQSESIYWLLACLALGMGALAKTVPLCLAPLLLLSVRKLGRLEQLLGLFLLLMPITLGLSIIYVLTPADVTTKVLGYRSTPGNFGFSGLFNLFGATGLQAAWPRIFELVYGLGWLGLGAWLLIRQALGRRQIIYIASGLLLAIAAIGPGYGLQYVYWFLPLLIFLYALEDRRMRIFLLALYAVMLVTYTLEYGLNYSGYGAFLLDLTQDESLIKFGASISTFQGQTILCLPLWLLFCWFAGEFGWRTGREMLRDFRVWRQRT